MKRSGRLVAVRRLWPLYLLISLSIGAPYAAASDAPTTPVRSSQDGGRAAAEQSVKEAEALRARGTEKEARAALGKYQVALEIWRRLRDARQEGLTLLALAETLDDLREAKAALDYLPEALSTLDHVGTAADKAAALKLAAIIYGRLGRIDESIDYALLALPLFRELRDHGGEANILFNVGGMLLLESKDDAESYFKQAVEVWRGVRDRQAEAVLLNNIGKEYSRVHRPEKAIEYAGQALAVWRALGDRREEAYTLNNLGLFHAEAGEGYAGVEHLTKAAAMLRDLSETRGAAIALENVGLILDDLGQKQQAIQYLDEAVRLFQSLKDEASEAKSHNDLGFVYATTGAYQKALQHYQKALTLHRAIGNKESEANTLHNIAGIYGAVEDKQTMLIYLNQARQLFRSVGNSVGEANTLNSLASRHAEDGEHQKALGLYAQVLEVFRDVGERRGQIGVMSNIAAIYKSHLRDYAKALGFYEAALELAREAHDLAQEKNVLTNIGTFYYETNEKQKALDYYQRALTLARTMGEPRVEAYTLAAIGTVHNSNGDYARALEVYGQAIDGLEKARSAVRIEEFKTRLADQSSAVYQTAVALSMKLRRPADAFSLSERARARTFLDQLGGGAPDVAQGADKQLVEQQQTLQFGLSDLRRRLARQRMLPADQRDVAATRELERQLAGKMRDYEELLIRVKATSPRYDSLVSVNPPALAEVQKLLDRDTTLVSYFRADANTVLAFVITNDSFRAVELRVDEKTLEAAVALFRGFASRDEPQPNVLKRLYGWLFEPLRQHVRTKTVGVVPHGTLHYLPFSALVDDAGYLGSRYTFFYLPSVSAMQFAKNNRKAARGERVLALAHGTAEGLPLLQYAKATAEKVAGLYRTIALNDGRATESALRAGAGASDILFLAAHGKLNAASPLFSNIFLAPDGQHDGSLEVHEVYGLNLARADLVVLSACQTQLGHGGAGDDIVGLNRAFMYAGAQTIVASLWSVPEQQTGELMLSFFTHLCAGKSKAEALAAAQAEVRSRHPNPYFWAAFVLTGDGGTSVSNSYVRH